VKRDSVITYLRLEGGGVLLFSIVAYLSLGGPGWLWFLALLPDLSFLAYRSGPRSGAHIYNLAHTYLMPFLLGLLGRLTGFPVLYEVALIWTAYVGDDRLFGSGLKRPTAFGDTHLTPRQPDPV
jgi:Domain of unknown function (DUF4260)